MGLLTNLVSNITTGAGRTRLLLQKESPTIMLVTGAVMCVGATVLACRKTLQLEEVLHDIEEERLVLDHWKDADDEEKKELMDRGYSEEVYRRDLTTYYAHSAGRLVRHYILPVCIGTVGLALIIGSHAVLNKRLNGVMAAYALLDQSFKEYRERVAAEVGEEREKDIRYGMARSEEKKEVRTVEDISDSYLKSPYSRFFDPSNGNWNQDPEISKFFLHCAQNEMNNKLQARGHVFLNEVYERIGFEHTQAGAVVGWVLGNGDDYIDFGMYDIHSEASRRFANNLENVILLDFNVDGVIYDKI